MRIHRASCGRDWGLCRFEDNKATFGGAVFLVVDEQIDLVRRRNYLIARTTFRNNNADYEGGALHVSSTKTESNLVSQNAFVFLLTVEESAFRENT